MISNHYFQISEYNIMWGDKNQNKYILFVFLYDNYLWQWTFYFYFIYLYNA